RVGRLQPVAHDVALRAHTLELARVVRPLDRDVADALVPEARPHRLLRQQDDRMVDREGDRAAACNGRRLVGRVRLHDTQLDVDREALRELEPAPVAIEARSEERRVGKEYRSKWTRT